MQDSAAPDRPKIAVLYLARFAEGLAPFRRFLESYTRNPAGTPHDLVVIYKGYSQQADLAQAHEIFRDVPHIGINLDDTGFDIGSYVEACRRIPHSYVTCLNTFTEVVAPNWLLNLFQHASRPGVGIAGAMGSYESLLNSFGTIHNVIWLCNTANIGYDESFHQYFDFIIQPLCPRWLAECQKAGVAPRLRSVLAQAVRRKSLKVTFRGLWWKLTRDGKPFSEYAGFPAFPNPHTRSNGFMVRRDLLLLFRSSPFTAKIQACEFESGKDSLTAQLRRKGLVPIVVGRDGRGFGIADWPNSGTFRLGDQANLLLTDNQSRAFTAMSLRVRATHVYMTWGDYLDGPPADFPDLIFSFPKRIDFAKETSTSADTMREMPQTGVP